MKTPPLVSINMPVYNAQKYLNRSINSALNQTYENIEIIVVDDGSQDDSWETILGFRDDRIKPFRNRTNQGISYTRNRCLELSKGEFIAVLDSDDIAFPTRIETQVAFLNQHKSVGMLGAQYKYIDEGEQPVAPFSSSIWATPRELRSLLIVQNCFGHSTVMFRTAALQELKYPEDYRVAEDYYLFCQLAKNWDVAILKDVLCAYRVSGQNATSKSHDDFGRFELKILENQLKFFGYQPLDIINIYRLIKYFQIIRFQDLLKLYYEIVNLKKSKTSPNYDKKLVVDVLEERFRHIKARYVSVFIKNTDKYSFGLLSQFYNQKLEIYRDFSIIWQMKFLFKCIISFEKVQ